MQSVCNIYFIKVVKSTYNLESPVLSPGWQYNLNVFAHVKATDDFLTLDEKDKDCSIESKEDCSTRSYVMRVTQGCGCLPLSLRSKDYSMVNLHLYLKSKYESFS